MRSKRFLVNSSKLLMKWWKAHNKQSNLKKPNNSFCSNIRNCAKSVYQDFVTDSYQQASSHWLFESGRGGCWVGHSENYPLVTGWYQVNKGGQCSSMVADWLLVPRDLGLNWKILYRCFCKQLKDIFFQCWSSFSKIWVLSYRSYLWQ